jgi:hypothetical protein
VTELMGYRSGWSHRRWLEADGGPGAAGASVWVGDGDCHAVPEGSVTALCGVACTHLDEGPFIGRPGQCRECVIALRAQALD